MISRARNARRSTRAVEQQVTAGNAATQAQIARMRAESSRGTLEHIRRRGEIRNEAAQEAARMRNETWRAGQAAQDRTHRETARTIREIQGCRDPRRELGIAGEALQRTRE